MFKEDFKEIISYFLVIDFVFYDEEGAEKHNNWFSDEQQNKVIYIKYYTTKLFASNKKDYLQQYFNNKKLYKQPK